MVWDIFMELQILNKFSNTMKKNVQDIFNLINKFVKRGYTNTINNNYYYIPYRDPHIVENPTIPHSTIPHSTIPHSTFNKSMTYDKPFTKSTSIESPGSFSIPQLFEKTHELPINNNSQEDITNELIMLINDKLANINNIII